VKKLYTFLIALISISCTQNERVKDYGGLDRLGISSDEFFVDATFNQTDLWVTTRKRGKTDTLYQTYYLGGKLPYGVLEGTYEIIEKKK